MLSDCVLHILPSIESFYCDVVMFANLSTVISSL